MYPKGTHMIIRILYKTSTKDVSLTLCYSGKALELLTPATMGKEPPPALQSLGRTPVTPL